MPLLFWNVYKPRISFDGILKMNQFITRKYYVKQFVGQHCLITEKLSCIFITYIIHAH